MLIDRCYILLGSFNRQSRSGGSDFYQIDMREIMGGLYDKYTRFNLKLEAYHGRTANSVGLPSETQFLQVAGFNWLGGLDTNVAFQGSRVVGVMLFDHLATNPEFQRGMIYPSNIATQTFARHANPQITMELFATDPDLTTKITTLFGNEDVNYLFSFTGVDESRMPLYREPEIIEKTGQLILNTAQALELDTNRRAVRWSVDLSQLIDRNTYNKYGKFALVTKMIHSRPLNVSSSGFSGITLLMSGLQWFSPNLKLNRTYTGNTDAFNSFHHGPATAIALIDTVNTDIVKETFVENVFYKPSSPIVSLTMTYNAISNLALSGVTAQILPFYFIFNIVPVD